MNEKLIRRISFALLALSLIAGLFSMFCFLEVNRIRADEFLSFLHSDPDFHSTITNVWSNISNGADNSYIHAVALQKWFSCYGSNIVVQRSLSLLFWIAGGFILWLILHKYEKSLLQRSLFWALIQFSNMGFLLASDGRFYSIHYFTAVCAFYFISKYLDQTKIKWLAALCVITFIAFLNVALSAVFISIFSAALFLLLLRKIISARTFIVLSGSMLLPAVAYFSVFRISHFHSHFSGWLFHKSSSDDLPLIEFISTPFRFFANAKLPILPDVAGVLITLFLFVCLVFLSRKKEQSQESGSLLLNEALLLVVLLLVIQVISHFAFSWPLWPYRYYSGVFWILPLWLFAQTNVVFNKKTLIITMLLTLSVCSRMFDEVLKVNQRLSEIPEPVKEQTIYKEEFENYTTLAKMGEQYIRYPQTRSMLFLQTDSLSEKRNAYFMLLQRQGDDLKTASFTNN